MKHNHFTSTTIAAAAMWAMLAAPAFAGQHRGHDGGARTEGQAAPRAAEGARVANAPRAIAPQVVAPQVIAPRVITPRVVAPQVITPRMVVVQPGFAAPRVVAPRVIAPRVVRPYYYNPYYSFRPRFSVGFGLFVGYPVAYPSYYAAYPYPVPYPAPDPSATVPAPGTVDTSATGGLSFDITPGDAGVYVDGQYAGTVDQFNANQQPLPLAAGRHHVEIREAGFQTMAFDVDIIAGQVIPYQGSMQRF